MHLEPTYHKRIEGEEEAESESLGLFLIGAKFDGEEVPIDRHDNDLKNDASVVDAAAVSETAVEEEGTTGEERAGPAQSWSKKHLFCFVLW